MHSADDDEGGSSVTPPAPVPRADATARGTTRRISFGGGNPVADDDETDGEVDIIGEVEERMEGRGGGGSSECDGDFSGIQEGDGFGEDADVPMTQEEEEVNAGMQELNCSQDMGALPGVPFVGEEPEGGDREMTPVNSPQASDDVMPDNEVTVAVGGKQDLKTPGGPDSADAMKICGEVSPASTNSGDTVYVDALGETPDLAARKALSRASPEALDIPSDCAASPAATKNPSSPAASPVVLDSSSDCAASPIALDSPSSGASSPAAMESGAADSSPRSAVDDDSDDVELASAAAVTAAASDSESDEDDDDLLEPVVPMRRATRASAAPNRYDPSAAGSGGGRGGSVFGVLGGSGGRRAAPRRAAAAPTAAVRRSHERHNERERDLKVLREEVQMAEQEGTGGGEAGGEEDMFAQMAAVQEAARIAAQASYDRFERPPPLFVEPVAMIGRDEEDWTPNEGNCVDYNVESLWLHPLTQVLHDAASHEKKGVDIGVMLSLSVMQWTIDPKGGVEVSHVFSDVLVRMLWQLVAHDNTKTSRPFGPGFRSSGDRYDIFAMLIELVKRGHSSSRALPPLRSLLAAFGADFDGAMTASEAAAADVERAETASQEFANLIEDEILAKTAGMERSSLDHEIVAVRDVDRDPSSMTARAARNLRRAFRVYEMAIQSGMDLKWLAKSETEVGQGLRQPRRPCDPGQWSEDDADAAVQLLITCARVVASPFGAELARDAGYAMSAVMERVPEDAWPAFRWRAVKALMGVSDRIGVQVAFATHDFPYLTCRARGLQLDFAFACLAHWCRGPSDDPRPVDVAKLRPPKPDGELFSYSLRDVTELLASVPEFKKRTQERWLLGVGQLAKQALGDTDVIMSRKPHELKQLIDRLKLLRKVSNRLGHGVMMHHFRLVLSTTLTVLSGHSENDKQAKRELFPESFGHKTQQSMHDMVKPKSED